MTCINIEEKLLLFVKKELSVDEATQVMKHLDMCQRCRRELDELKYLDGLLAQKTSLEEAPDFKIHLKRSMSWKYMVAAVILLFVIIIFVAREIFIVDRSVSEFSWDNGIFDEMMTLEYDLERISFDTWKSDLEDSHEPYLERLQSLQSDVDYLKQSKM